MVEMVVTPEQAQTIRTAKGKVVLRSAEGDLLGIVSEPEGIVENEATLIKEALDQRGKPQRWYTTDEVWKRLRQLAAEQLKRSSQ